MGRDRAARVGWETVIARAQLVIDEVRRDQVTAVLALRGELDIGTSEHLRQALAGYAWPGSTVTLDLSELTFCDSTGLAALIAVHKAVTAASGRLVLAAPVSRVRHLFGITGLGRVFTIDPPMRDDTAGDW